MVTSGFFNSKNGDRRYDAEDLSSIFDGMVCDGVFSSIGKQFLVEAIENPTTDELSVTVEAGRAWFNRCWILNDAKIIKTLEDAPTMYGDTRIDAIVIEVNKRDDVRSCDIKVVTGVSSNENPERPEMIHNEFINQYPIAYINIGNSVSQIEAKDITIVTGTTVCPWVTGLLEHFDATQLYSKWDEEFNNWFEDTRSILIDGSVAQNLQGEIDELRQIIEGFGNAEDNAY